MNTVHACINTRSLFTVDDDCSPFSVPALKDARNSFEKMRFGQYVALGSGEDTLTTTQKHKQNRVWGVSGGAHQSSHPGGVRAKKGSKP